MKNTTKSKPLGILVVSRKFGVPVKWLREEAEAGRIPHLKAGNTLLFNYEAVEECLGKRAGSRIC